MSDSKKYISLEFTHTEINELLKKINAGMVLTKEQYQKLISEIGLENISTFDGDYNKLENLPIIPTKLSELEIDVELKGDDVIIEGDMEEAEIIALIEKAIAEKADKEQLETMEDNFAALLESKVNVAEGYSLMADSEIERLSKVDNYDDSEIRELISGVEENKNFVEELQGELDILKVSVNNKVEKVEGHSLIADSEIERLSKVNSYDDSEIQLALRGKVDNEVIEIIQDEINNLNDEVDNKADAVKGCSLVPDEEIAKLVDLENYDDTELRGLLLDDEPYEMDFNNKHYVFACGHPTFAEMVNDELIISMGSTPEGAKQIIVPKDLLSKTILVGGFGIKNINKSRHLASTYIYAKNVELLAIHGGNFFEGSVGKSVVIVEDSKVKEIIGGGDAGKTLEKRGAYKNVVGETEVRLDNVTGCSLCYGGGGGHCSVGKSRVYVNNSDIQYVFACGANGITINGELYINSGNYDCASQVNRGVVVNSKIFMNGGEVQNFYFGGETEDTTVNGILHNGQIILNGGTINNLKFGTSNGVELTEMNGFIRDCVVNNEMPTKLIKLNDRPTDPEAGDFMFDVVLNKPIFFNGTNWVDSLGFIVG